MPRASAGVVEVAECEVGGPGMLGRNNELAVPGADVALRRRKSAAAVPMYNDKIVPTYCPSMSWQESSYQAIT